MGCWCAQAWCSSHGLRIVHPPDMNIDPHAYTKRGPGPGSLVSWPTSLAASLAATTLPHSPHPASLPPSPSPSAPQQNVFLGLVHSVMTNIGSKNTQQVQFSVLKTIKTYSKSLAAFATSARLEAALLNTIQVLMESMLCCCACDGGEGAAFATSDRLDAALLNTIQAGVGGAAV